MRQVIPAIRRAFDRGRAASRGIAGPVSLVRRQHFIKPIPAFGKGQSQHFKINPGHPNRDSTDGSPPDSMSFGSPLNTLLTHSYS